MDNQVIFVSYDLTNPDLMKFYQLLNIQPKIGNSSMLIRKTILKP